MEKALLEEEEDMEKKMTRASGRRKDQTTLNLVYYPDYLCLESALYA